MFSWRKKRPLRALQIEVTSRCTRKCLLCPRSALFDQWREGELSEAHWKSMESAFDLAEHIHLQGWGEPLLHPMLQQMTRSAKKSGATVGITTNGDLLGPATDWILDEKVDLLTLSVAGDNESHSRLRGGSSLEEVLDNVRALTKRRRKKTYPKVQISYLLTRDNSSHLPKLVDQSKSAGVDEIFVVHLDVTPTKELWDLRAFHRHGLLPGVENHLDTAQKIARKRHIRFREPARNAEEMLACALNPDRFVFVTFDGRVGPCVNLLFPVHGNIPRWGDEGLREVKQVCYGLLDEAPLDEILAGDNRARFTEPFIKRLQAEKRFWDSFLKECGAKAFRQLEPLDKKRSIALSAMPFPVECEGCHKKAGW